MIIVIAFLILTYNNYRRRISLLVVGARAGNPPAVVAPIAVFYAL
jgi:hypothetical protein